MLSVYAISKVVQLITSVNKFGNHKFVINKIGVGSQLIHGIRALHLGMVSKSGNEQFSG